MSKRFGLVVRFPERDQQVFAIEDRGKRGSVLLLPKSRFVDGEAEVQPIERHISIHPPGVNGTLIKQTIQQSHSEPITTTQFINHDHTGFRTIVYGALQGSNEEDPCSPEKIDELSVLANYNPNVNSLLYVLTVSSIGLALPRIPNVRLSSPISVGNINFSAYYTFIPIISLYQGGHIHLLTSKKRSASCRPYSPNQTQLQCLNRKS